MYAIYGTPEESLTYKFALALRKNFGLIPKITDKDYVVNSYHVDPREEIDALKKLEIEGEYLAWNSKNVTLVNCTISSLQGLCYVENLKLENCNLADTNLAFEYCSNIDATIVGGVKSILNPASGVIRADFIGTLTIQNDKVNSDDTEIICENIDAVTAEPDFEEN